MLVMGIDEAGRGPVIGPMVMAGVIIDEAHHKALKDMGVKDSKEISAPKREILFDKIYDIAEEVKYTVVLPHEIDKLRCFMTLNEIEALRASEIIDSFQTASSIIYVDSPDPNESYFSERITKYLSSAQKIKSEHFADKKYPSVSAASIIAKVIRDREIKKLEEKYGMVGSGYPHDSYTITFLEAWYREMREWPDFVRKSWDTVRIIEEKVHQAKLSDY